METISVPLSKRKLWLLLLASCLFVAVGIWLWGEAPSYDDLDRIKATFASVVCVIFFGLCIPVFVFKIIDRRAGVVINDQGIYRMGVFNYHDVIPWKHITHCTIGKIQRTRLLHIHVDNVEEILADLSPLKRWSQRMSIASSGTPYSLSSAALEGNFDDLKELIEAGIATYRDRQR
ncbi:MAG: hypothetical protein JNL43_13240 [Flavobacteriales bacterium]|nr:hypothetical protein [Flavobacteriales bacterium]HRH70233.1 STM3941 family protein [Flavobacteriales bacterium]